MTSMTILYNSRKRAIQQKTGHSACAICFRGRAGIILTLTTL